MLCSLHRFRSGWLASRTAQINILRGLLRELGLVIPLGAEKVVPQVRMRIADAESGIPDALRAVLAACEEIEALSDNVRLKAPKGKRPTGRVRKPGGGRKRTIEKIPSCWWILRG